MQFRELVSAIIKNFGLSSETIQAQKEFAMLINGDIEVNFEKDEDLENTYYLYSSLGTIPQKNKGQIYLKILQGNLFGSKTGNASIGYARERSELYLFQSVHLDKINFEQFLTKLKNFTETHKNWITRLQRTHHSPIKQETSATTTPDFAFQLKV